MGGFHRQSRIGEKGIFIFPAFFLVRVSRKDTLNEFETAIKMAPGEGIEPPTRRLTAARSASLSYPGMREFYKAPIGMCQGIGMKHRMGS